MAFNKVSVLTLILNLAIIAISAASAHFFSLTFIPALALLALLFLAPNLVFRPKFWSVEQDTKTLHEFFSYTIPKQFLAFMLFFFITFLCLMMYVDFFMDQELLRPAKYWSTILFSPLMFILMRWLMKKRLMTRTKFTKEIKK